MILFVVAIVMFYLNKGTLVCNFTRSKYSHENNNFLLKLYYLEKEYYCEFILKLTSIQFIYSTQFQYIFALILTVAI